MSKIISLGEVKYELEYEAMSNYIEYNTAFLRMNIRAGS